MRRILIALLLLAPAVAEAATYCECVANPALSGCSASYPGIATDSNLILCEDWEQPNLYDHSNVGGGSPNYGPWYDGTGSPAPYRRGYNSYWTQRYSQGSGNSTWTAGNPASPQFGSVCANSICREAEYCSEAQAVVNGVTSDCWDGNAEASIDIQRAGDYNAELGSITGPNPFSGSQAMFRRIRTGAGQQAEVVGRKYFTASQTIGYTAVVSLSNNWISSGLTGAQWKWDEWGTGDGTMFPLGATSEYGTSENMPFMPFVSVDAAYRRTFDGGDNSCVTAAAAATGSYGSVTCDTRYRFFPDPARYQRSTNWTNDAWHCAKGELSGIGTSSMRMRVWYDGDAAGNVIIDKTVDGTKVQAGDLSGISSFAWNAYSNWKETHTISGPVYRGYDNVHLTRGAPVSCASIGFGSAPSDPSIRLYPTTLSPSVAVDGTASQTFTVSNSGAGTLAYQVTEAISWLSVSPGTGTSTGEADTITVTYATSGLSAGTYTGTITVADNSSSPAATNSPQTVVVTLTVNPSGTARTLRGRRML